MKKKAELSGYTGVFMNNKLNSKNGCKLNDNPQLLKFVAAIFQDWVYRKHNNIFFLVETTQNGKFLEPLVDKFVEWMNTDEFDQYLESEEVKEYAKQVFSEKEEKNEPV